jgi:hypothetical protein
MTRPGLSPAAAALSALTAICATAGLIMQLTPGAATELREQLAFAFAREPADLAGAVGLAFKNFKVCALALTGAAAQLLYATSPRPRTATRWVFDTVLGVAYLANAAQFGVALGAYGTRLLAWIPHVPLELCALAVSAGAYLAARQRQLTARQLCGSAAIAGLLVIAAAIVETWAVPHR